MRTDFRLVRQPSAAAAPHVAAALIRENSRVTNDRQVSPGHPRPASAFQDYDAWTGAFDGHLSIFRKG